MDHADWLRRLTPPRRNRFFTGKMMGVAQFDREQRYGMGQRWLLNRLTLGTGIVCGLKAEKSDGTRIQLESGVAVDPWGREVIVANPFPFDPFKTAACGCSGSAIPDRAGRYYLCLSYHECEADPLAIPQSGDCAGVPECQADTTVETFIPSLVPVSASPVSAFSCVDWLEPLESGDPPGTANLREHLATMLKSRCAPPAAGCVVLGTAVLVGSPGALSIESLKPEGRIYLYSQAELFEMILCLAEQLAECCGSPKPTPTATPTPTPEPPPTPTPRPTPTPEPPPTPTPRPTPTPEPPPTPTPRPTPTPEPPPTPTPRPTPPPPRLTLKIEAIQFLSNEADRGKLTRREPPPEFQVVRELTGFQVFFNAAVDQGSVLADGVRVTRLTSAGAVPFPGTFTPSGRTSFVFHANGTIPVGEYAVVLFGNLGRGHGVITSMERSPQRLDGEPGDRDPLNPIPDAVPSGDDIEGGNFDFRFSVVR